MTLTCNRLSHVKKRAVAFDDIGQHPFDGNIRDRVRRGRIAGLHQKPGRRVEDVIWPVSGCARPARDQSCAKR